MTYEYKLEITFKTDRQLTEEELGNLQTQCCVQVEEPTTHEGDDVTYTTDDICTDIRLLWNNQAETPFGASYRYAVPDDGHQKRQQKGKK